jgi:hypothetical protein
MEIRSVSDINPQFFFCFRFLFLQEGALVIAGSDFVVPVKRRFAKYESNSLPCQKGILSAQEFRATASGRGC